MFCGGRNQPKSSRIQPKWSDSHHQGSWYTVQNGIVVLEEVDVDVDEVDDVVVVMDVLVEVVEVEFSIAVATIIAGEANENAIIANKAIENISIGCDRFPFIQPYLTSDVLLKLIPLSFRLSCSAPGNHYPDSHSYRYRKYYSDCRKEQA